MPYLMNNNMSLSTSKNLYLYKYLSNTELNKRKESNAFFISICSNDSHGRDKWHSSRIFCVQMDRITRATSLTSPTIPSSYTLLHLH